MKNSLLTLTLSVLATYLLRPVLAQVSVLRLELIDVASGSKIRNVKNGDTVDFNGSSIPKLNIKAVVTADALSAVFDFNGVTDYRIESLLPFSLCGDDGVIYKTCKTMGLGSHSVKVTPYSGKRAKGTAGSPLEVTFEIVSTSAPVPAPVVAPTPGDGITGFQLIYAPTGRAVIDDLVPGTVVNLADLGLPSSEFNVVAVDAGTSVKSVQFNHGKIDSQSPFTVCGTPSPGEFNACKKFRLNTSHTVSVVPFSEKQGQGTAFPLVETSFSIVAGSAPVAPPAQPPVTQETDEIRINCGGGSYTDVNGRLWEADDFFNGGRTSTVSSTPIGNTRDDTLFLSERLGTFTYEIPVDPTINYEVYIWFADLEFDEANRRVFNINVEGLLIPNVDIVGQAGSDFFAFSKVVPGVAEDGFMTIEFFKHDPVMSIPKVSAIELVVLKPHLAHSVPGQGYFGVLTETGGVANVRVDGSPSHTHAPGLALTSFLWKENNVVIATGAVTDLSLTLGTHFVDLTVADSAGNEDTYPTTIEVFPATFPSLTNISPKIGDIAGGELVTLWGTSLGGTTSVKFGSKTLSGNAVTVVSDTKVQVTAPPASRGAPVSVSAVTPEGESDSLTYTYVQNDTPIRFNDVDTGLRNFKPAAVAFGPDGKLYAASPGGQLARFDMNDDYTQVLGSVKSTINKETKRAILGIAFDPLETVETNPIPSVYITSSELYHGHELSSSGPAINGKIQKVEGANLDIVTDIVTGLPVSDHDHGLNGLYFGNHGEIYFNSGSNTNGGLPGALSQSRKLKENFLSSAMMVAHFGKSGFNGNLGYDAPDEGVPNQGYGPQGVELYGRGLRNAFGVTVHSNGKVYATDNGPNKFYGDMATGCGPGQTIPAVKTQDKLVVVEKDSWFGQANFARGKNGYPEECVWDGPGQTPRMMTLPSSSDGIAEFNSNAFGGQMRGDLIIAKHKGPLSRVILSSNGNSVNPASDPAIVLGGNNSLAVAMTPNGHILYGRFITFETFVLVPVESVSEMRINTVFPLRGGLAGGTTLNIYGEDFSGSPSVTVGGNACTSATVVSRKKITCVLPGGTEGLADVVLAIGATQSAFVDGYRYITGTPL